MLISITENIPEDLPPEGSITARRPDMDLRSVKTKVEASLEQTTP
jgi:hypothetical protein